MKRQSSLKTRILLFIGSILTVFLIAIFSGVLLNFYREVENERIINERQRFNNSLDALSTFVKEKANIIGRIKRYPHLQVVAKETPARFYYREPLPESEEDIQKSWDKLSPEIQSFAQSIPRYQKGSPKNSYLMHEFNALEAVLDIEVFHNEDVLASFFAVQKTQDFLRGGEEKDVKQTWYPSARPWYIETLANNSLTISNPYEDIVTKKLIITFGASDFCVG